MSLSEIHLVSFTHLLKEFSLPAPTVINDEIDWMHSAFKSQTLPLSSTIFSFFALRMNSWIYPGNKQLTYADFKTEQQYVRLVLSLHFEVAGLKPIDWQQASHEIDRLVDYLKKPDLPESAVIFYLDNLIEGFNNLANLSPNEERAKFYLESLTKILNYCLFSQNTHLLSKFNFDSGYQQLFKYSSENSQKDFLSLFISFDWFTIFNHPGKITSWLHFLLKTSHRDKVLASYFRALEKNPDLFGTSIHFFIEEQLKYVVNETSSRVHLENLLRIYSRLPDQFYLDLWTIDDFILFYSQVKKEKNLPHYYFNSFIELLKKYHISLSEEGDCPEKAEIIAQCIQFHFDSYLAGNLAGVELQVHKEMPHSSYYFFDWSSPKGGPLNELKLLNPEVSLSDNLESMFGVKSARFKLKIKDLIYDKKFMRINTALFSLSLIKNLFEDKNYYLNLIDFHANSPLLTTGYSRFVKGLLTYEDPIKEVSEAISFIRQIYSEVKIFNFFKKNSDFFYIIQDLIDCHRGFKCLMNYADQDSSDKAQKMLELPKRIKSLDELHTIIYQRISLLQTKKVNLYSTNHPVFKLDGFCFLNYPWIISVPKNSWELKIYGSNMNNCVGGYLDKILSGESIILNILASNKPHMNIEIRNGKIWEMKKTKNENLTEQESKEISLALTLSGLVN